MPAQPSGGVWSHAVNAATDEILVTAETGAVNIAKMINHQALKPGQLEANLALLVNSRRMLEALRQAQCGLHSALATWKRENGDNTDVIGAKRFVDDVLKLIERPMELNTYNPEKP